MGEAGVGVNRPGVTRTREQEAALQAQMAAHAREQALIAQRNAEPPPPPVRRGFPSRAGSLDKTLLGLGVTVGEVYGQNPETAFTDDDEAEREALLKEQQAQRIAASVLNTPTQPTAGEFTEPDVVRDAEDEADDRR